MRGVLRSPAYAVAGFLGTAFLLTACGSEGAGATATPGNGSDIPEQARSAGIPVSVGAAEGPPQSASAVAVTPDGTTVIAVNPDSDSLTLVDTRTLEVRAEIAVGDDPRTVAITPDGAHALVANHAGASVSAVDLSTHAEVARWPIGSMPYGVVTDGRVAYVSSFALGEVHEIDLASGQTANVIPVGEFPAGLALNPDPSQLLVTHMFDGSLSIIDPARRTGARVPTGPDSNVSQFVAVSPDGSLAYLPQTRSNVTNTALLFDTTVFPVVNVVDLASRSLAGRQRITLDTADKPVSLPFALSLSPDGGRAFVASAGSDEVSVIDLETRRGVGNVKVGANPRGIAVSPDGSRIYVNNVLDGTLTVIDADGLAVRATVKLTDIPLDPAVLLGKKIFNSAREPDLATDNWISCATCHIDGGTDKRTWLGFPDGPRNTPALFGVGDTLPVHWSGDLDELADVELTIRDIQAGAGLVEGAAFDSLGPPHSGLSGELDALVAYMRTLEPLPPPRTAPGEALEAGRQVFKAQGCGECHLPGAFMDGKLHDVGTGDPALERNSHGRGTAFDTPSLRNLWLSAPYLHDGSAPTLPDVLRAGSTHAVADSLSEAEIEDLVAYLLALSISR